MHGELTSRFSLRFIVDILPLISSIWRLFSTVWIPNRLQTIIFVRISLASIDIGLLLEESIHKLQINSENY